MNIRTELGMLHTDLFPQTERDRLSHMVASHQTERRKNINQKDRNTWTRLKNRADWEAFVKPRITALRASLGIYPAPPNPLPVHTGSTVEGDGYQIENLVFESRPGIFVTANLYCPSKPQNGMPGIILVHSHHNPKTQGELQDMGMLWARAGCLVLVMDQFCYGERGNHHPGPRQDYRFRYITGMQLYALGDSLMGWMVWDIQRGVDLLLSRRGIDPAKIILMGSVAGGGDPAAVAAALDNRIACTVPFNFGGPQPETPYPLPEDAEKSFNYLGSGSWESTRNLRLSGRDGFLPYLIAGSMAPRKLIYAHEFFWDQARDPVWKRLRKIFDWYNAADHLDHTEGFGLLQGRPPEASHCNNIGAPHRQRIYAALERWFGITPPAQERQERLTEDKLRCWTPELQQKLNPLPVHQLLCALGNQRAQTANQALENKPPKTRRHTLQKTWANILGNIKPQTDFAETNDPQVFENLTCERIVLTFEPHILVPLLLCLPKSKTPPTAIVVGLSQSGKKAFLSKHAEQIANLLSSGIAVCLPDIRGTGETCPEGSRSPRSRASSLSATELMLGQTMLGARLRDVRSILSYLRIRFSKSSLSLWGDSFAPINPPDMPDPQMEDAEGPQPAEPLGGLLALFGALFEDDIKAVVIKGMITGYQSLLNNTCCYVPHDAVVPGALQTGDLCDIAATLSPCFLHLSRLVDGRNCLVPSENIHPIYAPVQTAYSKTPDHLCLDPDEKTDAATWFITRLGQ